MKKMIVICLALVMILSLGAYAFADHSFNGSEKDQEEILLIQEVFLEDQVTQGILTQDQADEMYLELAQGNHHVLRGLGFGLWLRESDFVDLMPHRGRSGCGRQR